MYYVRIQSINNILVGLTALVARTGKQTAEKRVVYALPRVVTPYGIDHSDAG